MILAIYDKEKILNENTEKRIQHIRVKKGLAKANTLVIFAQHDEGDTFVYAYARLTKSELDGELEKWRLTAIRPFVAERQLLTQTKIQSLSSNALHFLHDYLPVAKMLEKTCMDNAAIELEIAYNILDENLWMSDLLLSDRRITAEYTDHDLIRTAHKMADQVRAFAADMEGFEDYFENYEPEPDPDEWNPTEEEIAEIENSIMQILTDSDFDE